MNKPLTPQEEAFAVAYADPSCKGTTDAYKRAGYSTKGKPETVNRQASTVLMRPRVAARIAELRAATAEAAMIDAAGVLREWLTIATADPAELTRTRRWCCRHCYGIDHRYQWVNDEEFAIACARVIDWNATKPSRAGAKSMPAFDGGVGFDRTKAPSESCPHCGGDGEFDVFVEDTSRLSVAGRKLFAGVRVTQSGIEIKTRDQDAALVNIAKYLGMLADRHMHGGDPNNPTPIASLHAEISPAEAAKLYAAAMGATK